MKMLWQWVPCEHNSSYNFILIFLNFCTCFRHGLEMCIWFGYNPWIIFCHFFHFVNFVIFWPQILWKSRDSGYLVSAAPHTILYRSLWNFAHVFAMVWRCAHGLDIILELIFVTFSTLWTLSFLTSDSMKVYRHCHSLLDSVSATLYTISCLSLCNFAHLFFHGLKMCMWFGFNPAVNFCHFSTLLTLSVFAGATSTLPKFDLLLISLFSIWSCSIISYREIRWVIDDNKYLGMIFSLFLLKNISCGYSLELPCQGDSNEYPQHMFLWWTEENCPLIIIRYPGWQLFLIIVPASDKNLS